MSEIVSAVKDLVPQFHGIVAQLIVVWGLVVAFLYSLEKVIWLISVVTPWKWDDKLDAWLKSVLPKLGKK